MGEAASECSYPLRPSSPRRLHTEEFNHYWNEIRRMPVCRIAWWILRVRVSRVRWWVRVRRGRGEWEEKELRCCGRKWVRYKQRKRKRNCSSSSTSKQPVLGLREWRPLYHAIEPEQKTSQCFSYSFTYSLTPSSSFVLRRRSIVGRVTDAQINSGLLHSPRLDDLRCRRLGCCCCCCNDSYVHTNATRATIQAQNYYVSIGELHSHVFYRTKLFFIFFYLHHSQPRRSHFCSFYFLSTFHLFYFKHYHDIVIRDRNFFYHAWGRHFITRL